MGISINYLSLPENCSLLESTNRSEEVLRWTGRIPDFLTDLEGEHPSKLDESSTTPRRTLNPRLQQFYTPYYSPFRNIWKEYVSLCETHPGLEARFCASSKDWDRLTRCLPDQKITLNGTSFDLSWKSVHGSESLSVDGDFMYSPAEIVFEIAAYLNHVTVEQIGLGYRWSQRGYAWSVYNDRVLVCLKEHFVRLQEFYNASAEHGEAVIVSRW